MTDNLDRTGFEDIQDLKTCIEEYKEREKNIFSILNACVNKKFKVNGFVTGIILGDKDVGVIFQRIGHHELKKYHLTYDEISVLIL